MQSKLQKYSLLIGGFLLISYLVLRFSPLPSTRIPVSAVLLDREEQLLGASIASDGQWRFPDALEVPDKLEQCILTFEDRYFRYHLGINPVSLARATVQNMKAGARVSGASTLTMQVARMLYKGERSYWQKAKEAFTALQLEARYSKDEILRKYVSLAPYGGNTVGLDAATWRYFGRPAWQLSWAEAALLAVLPNQPSGLFPGRAQDRLKRKRDRLLVRMIERGLIPEEEGQLAMSEPLPERPYDIPTQNSHLLQTLVKRHGQGRFVSTLAPYWQQQAQSITDRYQQLFKANGIENIAAIVVDLKDNQVLAYIGNTNDLSADGQQVDIIQSLRSSGSLLKPMLMAAAMDKGIISPTTLLPDIPTFFSGFTPKNFNHNYEGAIGVSDALARSLNIPFVHLLKAYNHEQFQLDLIQSGWSSIVKETNRYGLSLVLGGAEVRLWDVANVYTSWYQQLSGQPFEGIEVYNSPPVKAKAIFQPISTWHVLNAMTQLVRPGMDQSWESFSSSQTVAWKTGTSIGFRDAWAVGMNGTILAAVWVGNADGEGRAALTGSGTAGQVLLEILSLSDSDPKWLENLNPIAATQQICSHSGHLAAPYCREQLTVRLPEAASRLGQCTYHQHYYTDSLSLFRVNSACYPMHAAKEEVGYVLPSAWAHYYRQKHAEYAGLPPMMDNCLEKTNPIALIYPTAASSIYIPKGGMDKEKVVFQATHSGGQNSNLFWHLDAQYLGETVGNHDMTLWLGKGDYQLLLTDLQGNRLLRQVRILSD
jgi:penicillin-binding protein 1C